MSPGQLQGCSRGIYGLSTWDAPRPPHPETLQQLGITNKQDLFTDSTLEVSISEGSNKLQLPAKLKRMPMIAKYAYSANPDSPLGRELSVKKGDALSFLKSHQDNNSWWLAENIDGEIGYVPMSYMLLLDE